MSLKKAIRNGVVKIVSANYPIIISTRYFVDWSPALFSEDNDIIAAPNKGDLRKQIKRSFEDLSLGVMLMDGDLGDNPSIDSVAPILFGIRRRLNAMLPKTMPLEQRDFILSRAYIRALKDFAKRSSKLLGFLKKNPQYTIYPKKPSESKKKSSSKKKTTGKKGVRAQFSDKKIKKAIKEMVKSGDVRKLTKNPRGEAEYVALYLDSASLSSKSARTENTKKKALNNRKKLLTILKKR
jgi:hypothetical protein